MSSLEYSNMHRQMIFEIHLSSGGVGKFPGNRGGWPGASQRCNDRQNFHAHTETDTTRFFYTRHISVVVLCGVSVQHWSLASVTKSVYYVVLGDAAGVTL